MLLLSSCWVFLVSFSKSRENNKIKDRGAAPLLSDRHRAPSVGAGGKAGPSLPPVTHAMICWHGPTRHIVTSLADRREGRPGVVKNCHTQNNINSNNINNVTHNILYNGTTEMVRDFFFHYMADGEGAQKIIIL